ncbi:hypothetical protein Droror1_Dr00010058 [Drosera rotundifolia]
MHQNIIRELPLSTKSYVSSALGKEGPGFFGFIVAQAHIAKANKQVVQEHHVSETVGVSKLRFKRKNRNILVFFGCGLFGSIFSIFIKNSVRFDSGNLNSILTKLIEILLLIINSVEFCGIFLWFTQWAISKPGR